MRLLLIESPVGQRGEWWDADIRLAFAERTNSYEGLVAINTMSLRQAREFEKRR